MKTICRSSHLHTTKMEARACNERLLGRCLASMSWAKDKLEKEIRYVEEVGCDGVSTYATMRAVAASLDVNSNPRLKVSQPKGPRHEQ